MPPPGLHTYLQVLEKVSRAEQATQPYDTRRLNCVNVGGSAPGRWGTRGLLCAAASKFFFKNCVQSTCIITPVSLSRVRSCLFARPGLLPSTELKC